MTPKAPPGIILLDGAASDTGSNAGVAPVPALSTPPHEEMTCRGCKFDTDDGPPENRPCASCRRISLHDYDRDRWQPKPSATEPGEMRCDKCGYTAPSGGMVLLDWPCTDSTNPECLGHYRRVERVAPSPIRDQPPPTPAAGDVWVLVLKDMEDRRQLGIARYGVPLQVDNRRDHLTDAYQEALDLAVYLRAEIERRRESADGAGEKSR